MTITENGSKLSFDADISTRDIQDLSSAEGVAAFFAKLGYDTNNRTTQTAGNLGITAEGTSRPIKQIRQIADQEGLFKVYLFELTSVTIAHTRALARTFRTLSGNYLLILTSDYDRLDFVLVERYVPFTGNGTSNIAQKQASVRPRTLTVDRRNPSRVQLRVLRRLTWTESDPFAQYEKLLSAYSVADWSEELFNNRALFSDYYLRERLRERSEWREDPKPAYVALRQLYQDATSRLAGKDEETLRRELIEPVFNLLGHQAQTGKKASSADTEADYRLYSKQDKDSPRALSLVYPWGRSLDGKDYERDTGSADENPGAVVVSLLEKGEASWAIITNGKLWRLYSQRTHSKATNYYEIDLEEVLAATGPQADPADAFRYFWLLFRAQSYEPIDILLEGKTVSLSFLDQLLTESEDYAKELGERLKGRVFEEVFPHLAEGFIAYIRDREGLAAVEISEGTLNSVFQGTLTLLYRLLFLLYAEARDLLPVKEVRGYWEASLKKLKDEIAEGAGPIEDEVSDRLNKQYRKDKFDLYERLTRLFVIIDRGDPSSNVPVYNGGLFLSQPSDDDDTPEADAARFLKSTRIADRFLARAVDLLARDEDPKRHDLVPIDYKSLGVRHLGSIYEGLLEFKVRIASEKLAVVKEKGREVYSSFKALPDKDQERAERRKQVLKKGQVYLENDKRERKATGSYYTPDYIVKYIVAHAVGPVLQEKFEKLRPRLREAQKWNREMTALARTKREPESKYDHGPAVEHKWSSLVDELFDIKILDPAMGSGHFLVEAVDFITDKTLDFLNGFPWNPARAHLIDIRETILRQMEEQGINIDEKRLTDVNLLKRHVLKRCIYGVDLNPMAVELAKVSLWLNCFTLGAPLSFIDHHLRLGNSLIGVTVEELTRAREIGQLSLLSGTEFESKKQQAVGGMLRVGGSPDVTAAQVRESRTLYRSANSAMNPVKRLLDVYNSQWFGNVPQRLRRGKKGGERNPALEFLRDGAVEEWATDPQIELPPEWQTVTENTVLACKAKRFFHWELEFPEVFYGLRKGTLNVVERLEGGGFDAIVGNPPYVATKQIPKAERDFFWATLRNFLSEEMDYYELFMLKTRSILKSFGFFGYIVPNTFYTATSFHLIREHLLMKEMCFESIVDFPYRFFPFPDVNKETCILICSRNQNNCCERFSAYSIRKEWIKARDQIDNRFFTGQPSRDRIAKREKALIFLSENEITKQIEFAGEPLGHIVASHKGWMSIPETTKTKKQRYNQELFYENQLNDDDQLRKICSPCIRGEDVHRYYLLPEVGESPPVFVNTSDMDKETAEWQFQPKIIIQRITGQNVDRLIAAMDGAGRYVAHPSTNLLNKRPRTEYKLNFVLAALNSRILNYFYKTLFGESNTNITSDALNFLPVPRIEFASSEANRTRDLRKLIEGYKSAIGLINKECRASGELFSQLHCESEAGDILHDFISYLVDELTSLLKSQQTGIRAFLGSIEDILLNTNARGDRSVENFVGKTTLNTFIGDYRNDDNEVTPFGSVWQVVLNNTRATAQSSESGVKSQLADEYQMALEKLLPIKSRLRTTDQLIEDILGHLYRLTAKQIQEMSQRSQTL